MTFSTVGPVAKARTFAVAVALTIAPLLTFGCGGGGKIVLSAGQQLDAADIDRDPIALLPGAPLAVGTFDVGALFKSNLGPDVVKIIDQLLPIGTESNFVAQRDVTRVYGAAYALRGADFCAVFQGDFDEAAIRKAAEAGAKTVIGVPLVQTRYADQDVYTAGSLGFVVITNHTVLAGDQNGIHRALDRLHTEKPRRVLPPWMMEVLANKSASMAGASDLTAQLAGGSPMLAFIGDMQQVRVLGNFAPPGINLTGSVAFEDAAKATHAIESFQKVNSLVRAASMFMSIGFAIPPVEVTAKDKDVIFAVTVDEATAKKGLKAATDAGKGVLAIRPTPRGK